jgi:hypothetical protein
MGFGGCFRPRSRYIDEWLADRVAPRLTFVQEHLARAIGEVQYRAFLKQSVVGKGTELGMIPEGGENSAIVSNTKICGVSLGRGSLSYH